VSADATFRPRVQVLPAATNTPMLRAGFAGNQEGALRSRFARLESHAFRHFISFSLSPRAPAFLLHPGFDALSAFHPVGRICEPEEIAQFIAFLGDATKSGFINGSALQIDGGIGGRLYDPN
jgi:NAD(P)-dependent dehydrogenase (short-subunit alcohol dehydrogenase family)